MTLFPIIREPPVRRRTRLSVKDGTRFAVSTDNAGDVLNVRSRMKPTPTQGIAGVFVDYLIFPGRGQLRCPARATDGISFMVEDQIRTGKITKVVHVRFASGRGGHGTNLVDCDGYGILQGTDGQDVFFVDTAVQDASFADLEAGLAVLYLLETGPLSRAAKVWVATAPTQIYGQAGDSRRDGTMARFCSR